MRDEILGVGLVGPLIRSHTGDYAVKEGVELVRESWKAILRTQKRINTGTVFIAPERFFRDTFGSNLSRLKHENLDESLIPAMESEIVTSLSENEPRSKITGIETTLFGGRDQRIRSKIYGLTVDTNERINLVLIRNADQSITFEE